MNKKLTCIMLVDDNPDDNFFHEREINKSNLVNTVIIKVTGLEALEYLKSRDEHKDPNPDVIFLDINMPRMNGWEFLEGYDKLDKKLQGQTIIIMLTNSQNPDDKARARTWGFVSDYITKPLTKELMKEIVDKYFDSGSEGV